MRMLVNTNTKYNRNVDQSPAQQMATDNLKKKKYHFFYFSEIISIFIFALIHMLEIISFIVFGGILMLGALFTYTFVIEPMYNPLNAIPGPKASGVLLGNA